MFTLFGLAVVLWLMRASFRTGAVPPHLRPDPSIPGAFLPYDPSYCDRHPLWPKFWRRLLGRPWPGDYVCPDHPNDPYVEDLSF
jgi:hypothetical protein